MGIKVKISLGFLKITRGDSQRGDTEIEGEIISFSLEPLWFRFSKFYEREILDGILNKAFVSLIPKKERANKSKKLHALYSHRECMQRISKILSDRLKKLALRIIRGPKVFVTRSWPSFHC